MCYPPLQKLSRSLEVDSKSSFKALPIYFFPKSLKHFSYIPLNNRNYKTEHKTLLTKSLFKNFRLPRARTRKRAAQRPQNVLVSNPRHPAPTPTQPRKLNRKSRPLRRPTFRLKSKSVAGFARREIQFNLVNQPDLALLHLQPSLLNITFAFTYSLHAMKPNLIKLCHFVLGHALPRLTSDRECCWSCTLLWLLLRSPIILAC